MTTKKSITKKSPATKANEKGIKAALAVTSANLARIEAAERGEKPAADAKAKPGAKLKAPKAVKEKKPKKMSGLDAAAKVLAESKEPLNAMDIVKAMASKGYWSSPNGKTPHATIYAAMVREIKDRGREARFTKKERGMFAASGRGA